MASRTRLWAVGLAAISIAAGSAAAQPSDTTLAVHVLNRLAFGPRPGDVERVLKMGVDRWIDTQLNPSPALDPAAIKALEGCRTWTEPVDSAIERLSYGVAFRPDGAGMRSSFGISFPGLWVIKRDSASRYGAVSSVYLESGQLLACRLARVEASDRQLLEVMTDFWENHFSIFPPVSQSRGLIVAFERSIIQPNALGKFRDLLGAVARSPAMLEYLDNPLNSAEPGRQTLREYVSTRMGTNHPQAPRRGMNENYARELLELHTLGVDGGYTEVDVREVARALTGWTHSRVEKPQVPEDIRWSDPSYGITYSSPAVFLFDSSRHDAEPKGVLGHTLPGGRGMEDASDVFDILARHPSTARFIARKLAVRFVSDSPPDALVERAAATYLRTDGDIREVVRSILTSPEFLAPEARGAKVKSPLELVLSTRRALNAPIDTAAEVIDILIDLGQRPFGKQTPEGWPETASGWVNAGTLAARIGFANRVATGKLPSFAIEASPIWKSYANESFDVQLGGVIQTLFYGSVSSDTRRALSAVRGDATGLESRSVHEERFRELLALALSSPEFQRR